MKARTAVVVVVAALGAACAGIQVGQDFAPGTSFAGYRTWDWMPTSGGAGHGTADSPMVDQRIRSAVEAALRDKGYQQVTTGEPDLRVGYNLVLDNRTDYQTINDSWGAGWRYGPTVSQTTARHYTVGTLVLDMFDAEAHQLLWRGYAEGEILPTATPQQRQERANKAVAKILKQFPPKG